MPCERQAEVGRSYIPGFLWSPMRAVFSSSSTPHTGLFLIIRKQITIAGSVTLQLYRCDQNLWSLCHNIRASASLCAGPRRRRVDRAELTRGRQ